MYLFVYQKTMENTKGLGETMEKVQQPKARGNRFICGRILCICENMLLSLKAIWNLKRFLMEP